MVDAVKDIAFSQKSTPIPIENSELPAPLIQYDESEKIWILSEPYQYQSDDYQMIVPANFKFDLASVPRPFWWAISPFDLSISAPLIHDFLYVYRGQAPQDSVIPYRTFTRLEADRLFDRMMEQEGVANWRRAISYRAVRLFGGLIVPNWET